MSDEQIVQIIYKLFQSRDYTHFIHLRERRLGRHNALSGYYEGILPFIDAITEIWMRHDKEFPLVQSIEFPTTDIKDYLIELSSLIEQITRSEIREDLKNKFAEVLELINQTLYRLSLDETYLEQNL